MCNTPSNLKRCGSIVPYAAAQLFVGYVLNRLFSWYYALYTGKYQCFEGQANHRNFICPSDNSTHSPCISTNETRLMRYFPAQGHGLFPHPKIVNVTVFDCDGLKGGFLNNSFIFNSSFIILGLCALIVLPIVLLRLIRKVVTFALLYWFQKKQSACLTKLETFIQEGDLKLSKLKGHVSEEVMSEIIKITDAGEMLQFRKDVGDIEFKSYESMFSKNQKYFLPFFEKVKEMREDEIFSSIVQLQDMIREDTTLYNEVMNALRNFNKFTPKVNEKLSKFKTLEV